MSEFQSIHWLLKIVNQKCNKTQKFGFGGQFLPILEFRHTLTFSARAAPDLGWKCFHKNSVSYPKKFIRDHRAGKKICSKTWKMQAGWKLSCNNNEWIWPLDSGLSRIHVCGTLKRKEDMYENYSHGTLNSTLISLWSNLR